MKKVSKYNHFFYLEKEDKYLVYNAISNGLARLDKTVYFALSQGDEQRKTFLVDESQRDLITQLKKGNILVDGDFDETEFLRTRFNMGKYGAKGLSLTIATTLDCNLGCVYCYEGAIPNKYPADTLEDDIAAFAANRIKQMGYKSLFVTWYGGEPMLNKEMIFSLSKKLMALCKKERVTYGAMVVTNGTILNKKIAGKLKSCKVSHIQITVDGPQEVHDKRRPFKGAKASSFKRIMENICRVYGLLPIHLRINVDRTNFDSTIQLLEQLEARDLLKDPASLYVYIGFTREWTSNCNNISSDCFSSREFTEAELEFQKILLERGYNIGNLYPKPANFCSAASPHGFVIEPGGEIHKCWSDVGNPEAYLGNVNKPLEFSNNLLKWLSFDPLSSFEECRNCEFFPLCNGGCPYIPIKKKENLEKDKYYNCTPWKTMMKEKIRLFLQEQVGTRIN